MYDNTSPGDLHIDWSGAPAPLHRIIEEVVDGSRKCSRATLDRVGFRIEPNLDIKPTNGVLDTQRHGLVKAQVFSRPFRVAVGRKVNDLPDE